MTLQKDDVVILVGPNNSGKTATLKGIWNYFYNRTNPNPVIGSIELEKEGTADNLVTWLKRLTKSVKSRSSNEFYFEGVHFRAAHHHPKSYWQEDWSSLLTFLGGFFCHLLTTAERLSAADPQPSISLLHDAAKHPIHVIQRDDSLEEEVTRQFRKAFGLDITVHRNAGSQVPIMIGDRPHLGQGRDRVSLEYVKELELLPSVETQGDGMRSFLGILLFSMGGSESVLLVDEPEAFLHPPQARHLGKVLASRTREDRQLFLATHSGDILRGALDSESQRARVIRIRRSGSVNVTRELKSEKIAQVWGDPLLRYSNILDGLFHEHVVLCEADADCRFYAAITDVLFPDDTEERKPDIMFTHCGGKQRLPLVIRALRDLDVPVSVVADFDLLNAEQPLREIVESKGSEWTIVANAWRNVKNAIDDKKPELSTDEVKKEIGRVLAEISEKIFPSEAKKRLQAILKRSSPWSTAKSQGTSILSGQQFQQCVDLMELLASVGIFIVPVGEMEGFVRSVGNHGPPWVSEALRRDLKHDHEFDGAKEFVKKFLPTQPGAPA